MHLPHLLRTFLGLLAILGFLGLEVKSADSAGRDANPSQADGWLPIVTLDMKRVFDEHPGFQKQMAQLKAEAAETSREIQSEADALKSSQQDFEQGNSGGEGKGTATARLLREQSELAARGQLARERFFERELQLYATQLQQIQRVVSQIAKSHNVQIAIRDHDLRRAPRRIAT